MRTRLMKMGWLLTAVVLISVSMTEMNQAAQRPAVTEVLAEMPSVAPYAYSTWVPLGALVPQALDAPDVYVRLIVVDGAVVPPTSNE